MAIQIPPKDPSVEPYVSGGTFDQRVWSQVARIPYGRLATYGQIADLIGAFGCARQVGWPCGGSSSRPAFPGTAW